MSSCINLYTRERYIYYNLHIKGSLRGSRDVVYKNTIVYVML